MSRVARAIGLERNDECWCGCRKGAREWFAAGHDPRFGPKLIEKLAARGYRSEMYAIAKEIQRGE